MTTTSPTRVTKTTIESAPYNNVLYYLDNRTYIKDPKHPNSTTKDRVFVYYSDPIVKGLNFNGYPYIVCDPPTIEYSKVSANGKCKNIGWKHQIIIRSARDGNSNVRKDVGKDDMLSISDNLNTMINNETVKQLFRELNQYSLNLTKINVDNAGSIKEQEVFESTYELEYETRMQVSD